MLLLFFVSAALVIASLIGFLRPTPHLTENSYWLMLAGYAVITLGVIFRKD
jgi:hypothetical protein